MIYNITDKNLKTKVEISTVIPLYNCQKYLDQIFLKIKKTFRSITDNYEVIFVEDHGGDDSLKILQNLSKKDKRFKVIALARNFGQHNAIICGFHYAKGDYVITMDGDLQHPPEEIKKLVDVIKSSDYDLVYGQYNKKKHSLIRNFGSEIHYLLPLVTHKKRIKISAFRIIKKRIIKKLIKSTNPKVNIDAFIYKIFPKVKIGKIIVNHLERKGSKSSYDLKKLIRFSLNFLWAYSNPYKKSHLPQYKVEKIWMN